jgi:protein-tyrosine phosphatase
LNEIVVAKTLVLLENTYHECAQHTQVLDLDNLNSIQRDLDTLDEALSYLERAVKIYRRIPQQKD